MTDKPTSGMAIVKTRVEIRVGSKLIFAPGPDELKYADDSERELAKKYTDTIVTVIGLDWDGNDDPQHPVGMRLDRFFVQFEDGFQPDRGLLREYFLAF